ncbi:MAG: hypothetical protein M1826_003625, partial [Phylliscum demangeonii]
TGSPSASASPFKHESVRNHPAGLTLASGALGSSPPIERKRRPASAAATGRRLTGVHSRLKKMVDKMYGWVEKKRSRSVVVKSRAASSWKK